MTNLIKFTRQNKNDCPIRNFHNFIGIFNYVNIEDFDTFIDINFSKCPIQYNISMLNIQPDKKLFLDKTLNFTGLVLREIPSRFFELLFNDIKGIDLRYNSLKTIIIDKGLDFYVAFKSTRFDFYVNQKLISKEICNYTLSFEINGNKIQYYEPFFSSLTTLVLHSSVKFSKETCPFIFKRARIKFLNIKMIQSSFINQNVLSFSEIPEDYGKQLNSIIYQLMLKIYRVKLDLSVLNQYVFKEIVSLDLNGLISSFQTDLFKSFAYLKVLRIKTQNVKGLLTNNNQWIQYLNYEVNVDINDQNEVSNNQDKLFFLIIFQTYSNVTFYDYPDKDFCFFSDFPHQKLIVPILKPIYKSSCSCTELFLIRHSYLLKDDILFYLDQTVSDYYELSQFYREEINEREYSICANSSIELSIFKCDFLSRLRKCKINSTNRTYLDREKIDVNLYMNDWYKLSEYSHYSFSNYINPFFSLISIILNIFIIIIYSNKTIEKDMKTAYKYLILNCYTNIFYVVLLLFQIFFTNCFFDSDLFCYRKADSQYVNYFEKIFVNVIKKALHTFSNLSYFWFILFRYIRITNKRNKIVSTLKKIQFKTFLIVSAFFCLLINFYAFYEHNKVVREVLFEINISQPNDNFKSNLSQTEYFIFNIFQYIKIIFADFLLVVLVISIDIRLSFFIQKQISRSSESLNISQRALKKKKNSQNRINAMIIWNGINFFFFRLPSSLMDLYGLLFLYNRQNEYSYRFLPNTSSYMVCRIFKFCSSLQEIFYFFYLFSFIFQFLIFYKLDKNFNESMMNIKKRISLILGIKNKQ